MNYYTGVGSRASPPLVIAQMKGMGEVFASLGWCLRSGGAGGADAAFEAGCDMGKGLKEIYLPWKGFNKHNSDKYNISQEAWDYASRIHPVWHKLTPAAKNLHARNVYQVMGESLSEPSLFLVCWTIDGCEHKKDRNIETGGTGTAIAIASENGIPVYNLANPGRLEKMRYDLSTIFGEQLS
jgi:hypothetical protein